VSLLRLALNFCIFHNNITARTTRAAQQARESITMAGNYVRVSSAPPHCLSPRLFGPAPLSLPDSWGHTIRKSKQFQPATTKPASHPATAITTTAAMKSHEMGF